VVFLDVLRVSKEGFLMLNYVLLGAASRNWLEEREYSG
jgi:hypothetical protein